MDAFLQLIADKVTQRNGYEYQKSLLKYMNNDTKIKIILVEGESIYDAQIWLGTTDDFWTPQLSGEHGLIIKFPKSFLRRLKPEQLAAFTLYKLKGQIAYEK